MKLECSGNETAVLDPLEHETQEFNDEFYTLIFIVVLWSSGKLFAWVGTPALLGEIVAGVILGPRLLDFAPEAHALEVFGKLGLILLMIEAGLHVDVDMVKIVGLRALGLGLIGSLLPMGMGYLAAVLVLRETPLEAFVIGATMATMSTGIVLNVMKAGRILNEPTGQLIIAASTVNEMVNISLLTELGAIATAGRWYTYIIPLVVMFVLVTILSVAAVQFMPWIMGKLVLPRVREDKREFVLLVILFAATLALIPVCRYAGSSELLGAFLAGLCFCRDEHVHHTWDKQVKRVATFLMRFFFACTIGFSVPIAEFVDWRVWWRAGVLLFCVLSKVAMGFFATPLKFWQVLIVGFAWGAWGEFSFILASTAVSFKIISREMYNAIVLATLISIVIFPLLLRFVLRRRAFKARKAIEKAKSCTASSAEGQVHSVYYCLQIRCSAHWGLSAAFLSTILDLGCKVVDFRTFHPLKNPSRPKIVSELYVRDGKLRLPLHLTLPEEDEELLDARIEEIVTRLHAVCRDPDAEVKASRWLPGEGTPEMIPHLRSQRRAPEPAQDICDPDHDVSNPGLGLRRRAASGQLAMVMSQEAAMRLQAAARQHTNEMRAMDSSTWPKSSRPRHELDGFVHCRSHDAFEGPVVVDDRQMIESGSEGSFDDVADFNPQPSLLDRFDSEGSSTERDSEENSEDD